MKFIPKVIHQTYNTRDLPLVLVENVNKIKRMNSDWEYRFYDDNDIEEYLSRFYPWTLELYQRINPDYGAVKADFFRYFLMYREGGVYLDIKSTMTKPLNDIIHNNDKYLLFHWDNNPGDKYEGFGISKDIPLPRGEFLQWIIVTSPQHPFLRNVIRSVCENFRNYSPYSLGTGRKGTLRLAGPIAYTLSILKQLDSYEYRMINSVKDAGFVYSVFYGQHDHQRLFEKHYSSQRTSILNTNLSVRFSTYLPYCLNRWRKKIKRNFGNRTSLLIMV